MRRAKEEHINTRFPAFCGLSNTHLHESKTYADRIVFNRQRGSQTGRGRSILERQRESSVGIGFAAAWD
jgi:hypothetical protein